MIIGKIGIIQAIRIMNTNKSQSDIVYCYNWQGLIMIMRTRGGDWSYTYNIGDIFDRINENRIKSGDQPLLERTLKGMFDLGQIFQYKITELLHYCRKSFGDPDLHRDSHLTINKVLVDPVDLSDELANLFMEEKFSKLGVTSENLYEVVLGTKIPREQFLSYHNEIAIFFNELIRKYAGNQSANKYFNGGY